MSRTSIAASTWAILLPLVLRDRIMRDFISQRVRSVPPSGIRRFFDIAATMEDVISLGIGEPDFVTPQRILEAGVSSLRHGETHYTSNSGTIELRKALSEYIQ